MNKIIGYGCKFSGESWGYALGVYREGGLLKSKKEAKEEIKVAKRRGDVSKKAKVKIFKVTVEVL